MYIDMHTVMNNLDDYVVLFRLVQCTCSNSKTINVPVVYMGQDIVIWMRAIYITRGVLRGGP